MQNAFYFDARGRAHDAETRKFIAHAAAHGRERLFSPEDAAARGVPFGTAWSPDTMLPDPEPPSPPAPSMAPSAPSMDHLPPPSFAATNPFDGGPPLPDGSTPSAPSAPPSAPADGAPAGGPPPFSFPDEDDAERLANAAPDCDCPHCQTEARTCARGHTWYPVNDATAQQCTAVLGNVICAARSARASREMPLEPQEFEFLTPAVKQVLQKRGGVALPYADLFGLGAGIAAVFLGSLRRPEPETQGPSVAGLRETIEQQQRVIHDLRRELAEMKEAA